jgi:hypothetical protein
MPPLRPVSRNSALNKSNHPRLRLRNTATGSSLGASTKIPHGPKMIDGTAASRSTIAANGRDSLAGAYWVRNTAIPTAIGTASTRAHIELNTVTMNKSRTPNARWLASTVSNTALVKKFAWLASQRRDDTNQKEYRDQKDRDDNCRTGSAATNLNSRSPRRTLRGSVAVSAGAEWLAVLGS